MTEPPQDAIADPDALRAALWPPSDAAVTFLVHRLGVRSICIEGDCDRQLVRSLRDHGVVVHRLSEANLEGGSRDLAREAERSGPLETGEAASFDVIICTASLERMPADDALAIVSRIASATSRVLLAPWWEEQTAATPDSIRRCLALFATFGFTPAADIECVALNAVRLDHSDDTHDRGIGGVVAELLAREQTLRSLSKVQKSWSVRIAAAEREKRDLLTRLQAAEAALRFKDEIRRLRWGSMLPLGVQLFWIRLTNRIAGTRRRRLRLAEDIRATGLFDEAYYRTHNPYVVEIGMDPALHFALMGWKMDRRPNPYFAPLYYSRQLGRGLRSERNPLLHFAHSGWTEKIRPSPEFDPIEYLASKPDLADTDINPLLHYVEEGYPSGPSVSSNDSLGAPRAAGRAIPKPLQAADAAAAPLRVYLDEKGEPTVTILLDDVVRGFASDRPGTAVVVGCAVARRLGVRLRIVIRSALCDPSIFEDILKANGGDHRFGIDFVQLPAASRRSLPITRDDKVLTTSFAATRAALGALPPKQILYLLQENERAGCPSGDERLLFDETLSRPGLNLLIETRALFDELAAGDQSGHLISRGQSFEPVASRVFPCGRREDERLNFVFYADADDRRNCYQRGLEAIHLAMCQDILSSNRWTFHFVGNRLEDVLLLEGIRPILHNSLDWGGYSALISSMDLGLCLVEAPGACRLALDLAAAGAVVVTSSFGEKDPCLSRNILTTRLEASAVCETLRRGSALAADMNARSINRRVDHIPRAWDLELTPALDGLRIGKA